MPNQPDPTWPVGTSKVFQPEGQGTRVPPNRRPSGNRKEGTPAAKEQRVPPPSARR